jgi:hypothetical protein
MEILPTGATLRFMEVPMARLDPEGVLASRETAVKARLQIEQQIATEFEPTAVVLNFQGVRAVTTTFVDECIARLIASRLAGFDQDHPLLVVNADDEVRHTVDTTLRARRLLVLALGSEGPEVLGGDEFLSQTMGVAFDLRRFSVLELAARLSLTPQAANNRLSYLVRSGALARARVIPSRGGKEFVYEVPAAIFEETDLGLALAKSRRAGGKRKLARQAPSRGHTRTVDTSG